MISALLSGYGKWGRVYARNLLEHPDYFLEAVHDPSGEAREDARAANLHTYRTFGDALDGTSAQLVILCAPIEDQVASTLLALQRHRHVMMAKPGPRTLIEAERIYTLADARHRSVTVDYTMMKAERYEELQAEVSEVVMFDALRVAADRRSPASIVDDLLVHDLAMLVGLDDQVTIDQVDVGEDRASVRLLNRWGARGCRLVAIRNAGLTDRQLIVNGIEWNQNETGESARPVWRRLSDMRDVVRGTKPDNRDVVRTTTRLLEEIRRSV